MNSTTGAGLKKAKKNTTTLNANANTHYPNEALVGETLKYIVNLIQWYVFSDLVTLIQWYVLSDLVT